MDEFGGRMVIVTGGFGALGSTIAAELESRGAVVARVGRGAAPGGHAWALGGVDLADESACRDAVARAVEACGPLHGLVNVAGAFEMARLAEGGVEVWDRMYRANLRTALCASYAALPYLASRPGGRIINIGAGSAAKGGAGAGAYAASKSGVARLTESLSEELRGSGVTVNAILPQIIDTPANRAAMPNADFAKWTPPVAIARVVAFLLSNEAEAVTGALIPVTGAN